MSKEYFMYTLLNTMRDKEYILKEKYISLKSQLCKKEFVHW